MHFSAVLALASLVVTSVHAGPSSTPSALEERTFFNCCNGGFLGGLGLRERSDETLAKRTFCLAKRTFWLNNNCPPTCTVSKCPVPANGLPVCTNNACDFNCLWPYIKSGSQCIKQCDASQCGGTSNGYAVCTNNACDIACNNGFTKQNGQCVSNCNSGNCVAPANGQASCRGDGTCGKTCNTGFTLSSDGNTCNSNCNSGNCVAPANGQASCRGDGTCGKSCNTGFTLSSDGNTCNSNCNSGNCVAPANGQASCRGDGTCGKTCNTGFTLSSDGNTCNSNCNSNNCVAPANGQASCRGDGTCGKTCNTGFTLSSDGNTCNSNCNSNNCVAPANGQASCKSDGTCVKTCNSGFVKQGDSCVASPPACTKVPYAFYTNFQTTQDGEPAVTVASLEACARYCAAKDCASFDFWDGNQCGIQLKSQGTGGPFDGFQYSDGVVHGILGSCSQFGNSCPSEVAKKACYDASFCPATSFRHRRIRRSAHSA